MNKKLVAITSIILLSILAAVFYGSYRGEAVPVIKCEAESSSAYAVYSADGDIMYINEIGAVKRNLMGSYSFKPEA